MDIRETCCEQMSGTATAHVTTNEVVWIRKLQKYAESYPKDVVITRHPEDNGGYLCAEVPKKWFVIRPPRKVQYTEEQKAAMQERMANMRKKKGE